MGEDDRTAKEQRAENGVATEERSLPRDPRIHPAFEAKIFRPGHTVQPTPAQRAEGKAASYRAAIVNNVPPERIVGWLNKAAELAASNRSWRGMLEVADIALRYGVGKPRAMADDAGSVDLTALLQTIAGLAEREGIAGETPTIPSEEQG